MGHRNRGPLGPEHQGRDEVPAGHGRRLGGQELHSPGGGVVGGVPRREGQRGVQTRVPGCLCTKLAQPWLQRPQGMEGGWEEAPCSVAVPLDTSSSAARPAPLGLGARAHLS